MNKSITPKQPALSATGIWYAYLGEQDVPGDGADHPIVMKQADCYGNTSLFTDQSIEASDLFSITALSVVWIECWFRQASEILADREVAFLLPVTGQVRGRAKIVGNYGAARYHGLFHPGETIQPIANATSDKVSVADGYISVIAQPV